VSLGSGDGDLSSIDDYDEITKFHAGCKDRFVFAKQESGDLGR